MGPARRVGQGEASRLLQQRPRGCGRSPDAARVRQRSQQRPRAGLRRERQVSRRVELRTAAGIRRPHVHHHERSVPVGGRPRHVEAGEVQPRRQVPVFLGRVGRISRRLLGRARHERRSGRQRLYCRGRQRRRAEVHAAEGCESRVPARQAGQSGVEVMSSASVAVNAAESETGLTRNQRRGFLAAWGGWALDGMDASIYALVLVPALTELLPRSGLEATQGNVGYYGSILQAMFLLGWGLSMVWGPISDRIGRVRALMLTIL